MSNIPWDPPWVHIEQQLTEITKHVTDIKQQLTTQGEETMADFTALNAEIATLQAQEATNQATLAQVNTAVQDLVAAVAAGDQPSIDAAAAAVQALTASLVTDETSLTTDAAADPGPQPA